MVTFPQCTVFILLQPPRSCIIFHPLGFVFHAQAVSSLVITEILAKIQTSTHGLQSPFSKVGPIRGDTSDTLHKIKKLASDLPISFANSQNVTLHRILGCCAIEPSRALVDPARSQTGKERPICLSVQLLRWDFCRSGAFRQLRASAHLPTASTI